MPWSSLLILALVIGSNNFAVALALGAHGQIRRRARIATVFGVFEFFVPLAGIWIGVTVAQRIGAIAGSIGVALIITLGVWTVWSAIRGPGHADEIVARITTNRGLVLLAAGLSIDNLLVGFSLGLGDANPLLVATSIAVFAVIFTLVGLQVGGASRTHWGSTAKVASGLLLIALGLANWAGWL